MGVKKYTMESRFSEIIDNPSCRELVNKFAPDLIGGTTARFIKDATMTVLANSTSGSKSKFFHILVDLANGEEVDLSQLDDSKDPPQVVANEELTYNIDDIDGRMYMLDHAFTGCLVLSFSKDMDEKVYGSVTHNGVKLPKGVLKFINTANRQMLGIPVRDVFTNYDTEYILHIEGFKAKDGNAMEAQDIKVKTLPKPMPDPAYEEHDKIALNAAREGIVLLKNTGNVLPLQESEEIWVEGINNLRLGAAGAGRINPRYSITLKRGVEEYSKFQIKEDAETVVVLISRPSGENIDNNATKGEYYLTDEEENQIAKPK